MVPSTGLRQPGYGNPCRPGANTEAVHAPWLIACAAALIFSPFSSCRSIDQTGTALPMCGRIDQNDLSCLLAGFAWANELFNRSHAEGSCNRCSRHLAAGAARRRRRTRTRGRRRLVCRRYFWWGTGHPGPMPREKFRLPSTPGLKKSPTVTGAVCSNGAGRSPANDWHEWTGEKGAAQCAEQGVRP